MSHVSTLMLILRPHVENFLSARGRYFFRVSEHHRYLCFDGAKIRNFQAFCKLFFKKDTKKSTLEKKSANWYRWQMAVFISSMHLTSVF